jgi:spore maturation protein CgeB
MKLAFFGSSLVSAYWNGAATYYRGIIKALYEIGYTIDFFEPDAYDRQTHRDMDDPGYATIHIYQPDEVSALQAMDAAMDADVIIKTSGVGVLDGFLEKEIAGLRKKGKFIIFWDVDAPATLDRMEQDVNDPFRDLVKQYNLVLTYGGGHPVINAYKSFGAVNCFPIYNALDPSTHHPVVKASTFEADLSFLGNRLPDREKRVDDFFFYTAAAMPGKRFLLGGSGWMDKSMTSNIHYTGHVYTKDHNQLNCSAKAVLNISRDSMAKYGFSPATRVFEAAGAGACVITDYWEGINEFFEPGREILVARNGEDVVRMLRDLRWENALEIGKAALKKVLAKHTYTQRAEELDRILESEFFKVKTKA